MLRPVKCEVFCVRLWQLEVVCATIAFGLGVDNDSVRDAFSFAVPFFWKHVR